MLQMCSAQAGLSGIGFDTSLGTIGGGNHFCELQAVDEIVEPDAAAAAGLDRDSAYLLVHSGSRGFGYSILERSTSRAGGTTLDPASDAGRKYLAEHDRAVRWASVNRRVIAARAAAAVRADDKALADLSHNFMEVQAGGVLHRKGTAPSDRGLVPIPGSRCTLSYLVEPLAAGAPRRSHRSRTARAANTTAPRSTAASARKKSDLERLARNPFGGHIICEDRALLVEEAPRPTRPSIGSLPISPSSDWRAWSPRSVRW